MSKERNIGQTSFLFKPNGTYGLIWWANGTWNVPVEKFQDKSPEEIAAYLDEHRVCSACGEKLLNNKAAGEHFAGHYCETCWEKYKARNSRRCGLCGRPLYRCNC